MMRFLARLFRRDEFWFAPGPTRTELMRGLTMSDVPQKTVRPVPSDRVRREPLPAQRDKIRRIR